MMKYLIFYVLFSIPLLGISQNSNRVLAYGKFKIEWGNNESTLITLFEDGENIDSYSPPENGKFDFDLELNHTYIFTFTKPGYVTKKVQFDTHVPETVTSDPEFFPFEDFDFNVTLFKVYPNVDTMFFENPVGKIQYYAKSNSFDYDKEYTLKILKRMEEIEREIKQKHEEEEIIIAKKKKNSKKEKVATVTRNKTKVEDDNNIKKKPITKNKNKAESERQNNKDVEIANQNDIVSEEKENTKTTGNSNKNGVNSSNIMVNADEHEIMPSAQAENIAANEEIVSNDFVAKDVKFRTDKKEVLDPKLDNNTMFNSKLHTNVQQTKNTAGKTTTRTSIVYNKQKYDLIKVEHSWGGKYYFIQYDKRQYQNISESYYKIMMDK